MLERQMYGFSTFLLFYDSIIEMVLVSDTRIWMVSMSNLWFQVAAKLVAGVDTHTHLILIAKYIFSKSLQNASSIESIISKIVFSTPFSRGQWKTWGKNARHEKFIGSRTKSNIITSNRQMYTNDVF